jgi:hypothetical protein
MCSPARDAVVYSGGGAATFYRGVWHPGRVFAAEELSSRGSRFSAIVDPDEVRRYLDAAHDALLRSIAIPEGGSASGMLPTPQPEEPVHSSQLPNVGGRPVPRPSTAGRKAANASVILGVLGVLSFYFLVWILFGIAAMVSGFSSRAQARRNGEKATRSAIVGVFVGAASILWVLLV